MKRDLAEHLILHHFFRNLRLLRFVPDDLMQSFGLRGTGQHIVHGDPEWPEFIGQGLAPTGDRTANGIAYTQVGQGLLHAGADHVDDAAMSDTASGPREKQKKVRAPEIGRAHV